MALTTTRISIALAILSLLGRGPAAEPARVPLTTSKVVGSPDPPPPYRTVNAFPKLRFDHPLHLTAAPDSDRLFVCEQGGKIFSFPNRPDVPSADVFFDVRKRADADLPPGVVFDNLYALAFHPKFATNRQCFVCYTLKNKVKPPNLPDGTRVSRFTVTDADPPRIDPASEEIVLTWLQGGHNGCDLRFGPDGFLYISAGDAEVPARPTPGTPARTSPTCWRRSSASTWTARTPARSTRSRRTTRSSG